MNNSGYPEDRRQDRSAEQVAQDLGFDSVVDFDIARQGRDELDRQLRQLLEETPPGREHDVERSIAMRANVVWEDLRERSLRYLPTIQLKSSAGLGLRVLRIAYNALQPLHGFEFTIDWTRTFAHKLVLDGGIASYERNSGGGGVMASTLLERYIQRIEAASHNPTDAKARGQT